ncbi:hypothetical protein [Pluralibacter sp.]|uniref:hypothetical protein n=1 Tax=Pluralibacter sp. TaxID=1920032 RepID=UPI0025E624CE|nr:hypothetical protein [Pluralibacter sp.]MBV8043536.1 hypothetical protein [Pluralibacter sp.]
MKNLLLGLLLLPGIVIAAPTPESAATGNLSVTDWQYVTQKISEGQKEWLDIVPALASKANHQQADQLEDALATALPINTKGVLSVLRVLDSGRYPEVQGTNIVCVQKVASSGKASESYYRDTRLALLDEPEGAQCLWNLEGVWEEVKHGQ